MASINTLRASDGSGNASVATVQSPRSAMATTLVVDTVQGINTKFHATMGTPHTFVDPVTSETITVISEATAVDFQGHVDGTNLEIDTIAPGYTDAGSAVNDIVIIKPTTQWADEVAEVLEVSHNDNGTLKDDTVDTGQLVDDSVTTAKIADSAVTSEKLGATIGFYATPTGNLSASPGDITTYTEVVDYGSDFASGVFTAPVAGFYAFAYNWRITDTASRVEGYIEKNGTEVAHSMNKGGSANNDPTPTNTIFINLAQGDTVGAGGWNEAGAAAFTTGSYFCGYLIGRV